MSSVLRWVEADQFCPFGDQPAVLSGGQVAVLASATCEQLVTGSLVLYFEIIINGLAGLF